VGELIGLIVFALIYGVFWFLSHVAKQAAEKQKQETAERQRQLQAERQQQQGAAGRPAQKKKFREIEQLRNMPDALAVALVAAESVSPSLQKRESAFDAPIDSAGSGHEPSGMAIGTSSMGQGLSDHPNPIAQGIMAMMATPQSLQQAVVLSEIFHRPKFE